MRLHAASERQRPAGVNGPIPPLYMGLPSAGSQKVFSAAATYLIDQATLVTRIAIRDSRVSVGRDKRVCPLREAARGRGRVKTHPSPKLNQRTETR
jgi:hypothetical protein